MTIRRSAPSFLVAVILASAACGGSAGQDARDIPRGTTLEDSLPLVVPTPVQYAALLDDWGELNVTVHVENYRTNDDLAAELPGDLLSTSNDAAAITASGRQTGYLVGYSAGMNDFACCTARMAVDVYDDEQSAQRRLEVPPFASTPSFQPKGIGNDAVAWLVAQSGDGRTCPCDLLFRVGPMVAAVSTSYHGPIRIYGAELEAVQEQLALLLAENMRAALSASDEGDTG
jgi:hypothetical protein